MRWLLVLGLAGCGRVGFGGSGDGGSPKDGNDPPDGTGLDDAGGSLYASAVLADGPSAFWRLGDSDMIIRDEVGGAPGAAFGGVTSDASGAVADDGAMLFNGSSGRIELGDRFDFTGVVPYTVEVWARPSGNINSNWIVHRRSTADPEAGWSLYHGPGYCIHSRNTNNMEFGYAAYDNGSLPLDEWTHIVAVFAGSTERLFINGVGSAEGNQGMAIDGGPGLLTLGDRVETQFFKYEGMLDEVAIYDYALSEAQIRAHYTASGR